MKDPLPESPAASSPAPELRDPNEILVSKAKSIIEQTGRATILVYVRKDGAEFPRPIRLQGVEQLEELSSRIYDAFGSGDFDYRVRVGGAFACGWQPISIREVEDEEEEDPEDEDEELDEEEDENPEAEDDLLEERPLTQAELIAAAVAAMRAEDAERRASEEREAARIRAIQDPLLQKIADLEKRLTPATQSPPPVDPTVLALKATVDRLAEQLSVQKQTDLETRLTKELASIKATLATPKKKKKRDPLEAALAHITRIAVVDKTLETLKARADDSESGSLLESSIAAFEEPLKNIMKDAAKQIEKTAKSTLRQDQAAGDAGSPHTPSPPSDVPADLVPWLQLVFKEQRRVLDVEFVRASLAHPVLGAQLERLARVTDTTTLHQTVSDLLGPVVLEAIKKEPPAYSEGIVQLCSALARTIQSAKAPKPTPPPPAAPAPQAQEKPKP